MGRPNKGQRKNFTLRVPRELHLELSHYSIDKDQDLSEILLEVISDWWEKQPDREKYKVLRANSSNQEAA